LAEAEANANHTLQELNEFRESGVLSNLEKENHQLEQENHQLEQEIKYPFITTIIYIYF